jgi:hypothetical protein
MPLVRCYLGRGLDQVVTCEPCAAAFESGGDVPAVRVCEACGVVVRRFGGADRNAGSPVPLERPEPFDATVRTVAVDGLPADLLDLGCADDTGRWYGLCADGTLAELDGWSVARIVATGAIVDEVPKEERPRQLPRPRLHVAPGGGYAAVVNDFGTRGRVVALADGSVAMPLDALHAKHRVVLHATDWNRLDVSDPAPGALLTARESPTYVRGQERAEHYLDYFHGALHASPDGRWVLDDGWIWSPYGCPSLWSVERWVEDDPWESEDGASKRLLTDRDQWDVAMCWLDDRYVAIALVNDDDETFVDGARVFDARGHDVSVDPRTGNRWCREVATFAGPGREAFFGDGSRLYAVDDDGLSVWDVRTGERTGRIDGFRPTRQSRSRGELVEARPREVAVWRYAAAFGEASGG